MIKSQFNLTTIDFSRRNDIMIWDKSNIFNLRDELLINWSLCWIFWENQNICCRSRNSVKFRLCFEALWSCCDNNFFRIMQIARNCCWSFFATLLRSWIENTKQAIRSKSSRITFIPRSRSWSRFNSSINLSKDVKSSPLNLKLLERFCRFDLLSMVQVNSKSAFFSVFSSFASDVIF